MVIDGKAGKGYAGLAGKPVFSPDSRRVAYIAMNTQNQWVVAVDDGESPDKHPSVKGHAGVSPELCFSPDGRRLAYVVVAESGGEVKQAVVVDHQEGAKYDAVDGLVFSPNGQRLAYAAKTGNQWAVVVDGREGRRHDSVFTGTPMFSPDGRHLAYGGREGHRSFVVVDRKEGVPGAEHGSRSLNTATTAAGTQWVGPAAELWAANPPAMTGTEMPASGCTAGTSSSRPQELIDDGPYRSPFAPGDLSEAKGARRPMRNTLLALLIEIRTEPSGARMTDDDARRGMILDVSDRGARKSAVPAAPRATGEFQSVVLVASRDFDTWLSACFAFSAHLHRPLLRSR